MRRSGRFIGLTRFRLSRRHSKRKTPLGVYATSCMDCTVRVRVRTQDTWVHVQQAGSPPRSPDPRASLPPKLASRTPCCLDQAQRVRGIAWQLHDAVGAARSLKQQWSCHSRTERYDGRALAASSCRERAPVATLRPCQRRAGVDVSCRPCSMRNTWCSGVHRRCAGVSTGGTERAAGGRSAARVHPELFMPRA